ncbi:sensor histidine kinase [Salinicoccus carnicancri]|uniref:sensor histidine kinase n=1 Tax=Salinicoccus carnicancri TaxID=558170 RepID=UPI0002E2EA30|nr:HAMP domain-containing sensor histidine kinase [Salinicoccus carnicancri]
MDMLYKRFIAVLFAVVGVSLAVSLLASNVLYAVYSKPKMNEQMLGTAENLKDALEQDIPAGSGLTVAMDMLDALDYQVVLVSGDGADDTGGGVTLTEGPFNSGYEAHFAGIPFERTVMEQSTLNSVLSGGVYEGEDAAVANWFMMGHFMNDVRNTVGVPVMLGGERHALFIKQDSSLMFSEFHIILLVFFVTAVLVSLIFIIVMSRRLTEPLGHLRTAANEIRRENFDYDIAPGNYSRDEIGQLAASLDAMKGQLQENHHMRQKFISDVTHDLQSPLVNIQGYAKLLEEGEVDGHEAREAASVVHSEAKRLSSLARQLMLLNKFDHQSYTAKVEPIRLDSQIRDVIRVFRWRLDESGVDLSYSLDEVTVESDSDLLWNIWDNLVSNAVKYSSDGDEIAVTLKDMGDNVEISVRDTGMGIPEDALDKVFERFYRVDAARSSEGSGLGLAIVLETVEMLGGTIDVESTPGAGTEFIVKLWK